MLIPSPRTPSPKSDNMDVYIAQYQDSNGQLQDEVTNNALNLDRDRQRGQLFTFPIGKQEQETIASPVEPEPPVANDDTSGDAHLQQQQGQVPSDAVLEEIASRLRHYGDEVDARVMAWHQSRRRTSRMQAVTTAACSLLAAIFTGDTDAGARLLVCSFQHQPSQPHLADILRLI